MPERKPRTKTEDADALIPRIEELYKAGKSIREVAEETDLSQAAVRRRLIVLGLIVLKDEKNAPTQRLSPDRQRRVLSDEEVERLRRLVGFNPDAPPERVTRGRGRRLRTDWP